MKKKKVKKSKDHKFQGAIYGTLSTVSTEIETNDTSRRK